MKIKEDTKYTLPLIDVDFELYKDMLVASLFADLMDKTTSGKI